MVMAAAILHFVKALAVEAASDTMYRYVIERAHEAIVMAVMER